jgi:regulator of replication initiation timing
MTVERKIRELLAGKQAITEASDGDMTAPKQGNSVTSSSEKMGASNGKDTSKASKSNTSGDQTQPRQGSSADAPHQDRDGDADENQGAKVAVNGKDSSASSGPASGPGNAPNFSTVDDPRSVVNQPSSKGNVHQEEYDPEEDEDEEVEDLEEEVDYDLFESIMLDEGDLSIRTLYNKYADHALGAGDSPEPKKAAAVKKAITKVHGSTVMGHLEKAKNAAAKNDQDSESHHFNAARNAAKSDTMGATVGKNRSSMRNEEFELEEDFSAELATLFDGNENLSEEFRGKAASLFEAMVSASVNVKVSALEEALIEEASTLMEEFKTELVEKVDSYLTYVAEQYIAENELAVENGLRSDITESFIAGLKNLFSEHYIEVPEEKYDVLGEMQVEIEDLQSRVDQTMTANVELHAENTRLQRESVLIAVTENLAKTDAEKFVSIVADVEFENAEIFEEKLNVIRENYFPKAQPNTEEKMTDGLDESNEYNSSPLMEKYSKALDRMSSQI